MPVLESLFNFWQSDIALFRFYLNFFLLQFEVANKNVCFLWIFELPFENSLSTENEKETEKFGSISFLEIQSGFLNCFFFLGKKIREEIDMEITLNCLGNFLPIFSKTILKIEKVSRTKCVAFPILHILCNFQRNM